MAEPDKPLKRRVLHVIKINEISGVDNPCQEHAKVTIMKRHEEFAEAQFYKRKFSAQQRRDLAASGAALPDGSYPIENKSDLSNAIDSYGHNPTARVKAHIVSRAKSLGASDTLPEDWNGSTKSADETISRKGDDSMAGDTNKNTELEGQVTDLEAQIADLTKKLEVATNASSRVLKAVEQQDQINKLGKQLSDATAELEKARVNIEELTKASAMSDAEKEHCKGMDAGEKAEFMAKPAADRQKAINKKAADDDSLTIEGHVIRKSVVGESQFAIFKATAEKLTKAQVDIAKERDARELADLRKRADDEYKHVPGTTDERATMLKAIGAMDEGTRKLFDSVLTQSEKLASTAFATVGHKDGTSDLDKARKNGKSDFEKRVDEIRTRDKCSSASAMSKARAEYPKEFEAYQAST